MTVHRTLEGGWAECEEPDNCRLLFHFPDTTVDEMAALPAVALLALLEAVQPANIEYNDGMKQWHNSVGMLHRRYDLPALIYPNGTMEWWQDGDRHRDDNKPAVIFISGETEWWHRGELYQP